MLVSGNVREGKTLLMVYFALQLHKWNQYFEPKYRLPIYTNFSLDYSEVRQVSVSELLDFEGLQGGLLCIDEAYTWLESRMSSSNLNRYVSYFLFQSGKRGVDVIATAQLSSTVDLRFYDLAHIVVLTRKDIANERFVYQMGVRTGVGVRVVTRHLSFVDAAKFWDSYITSEPVAPLGLKDLQAAMERFDTVKINQRVDAIVQRAVLEKERFGWYSPQSVYRYQVQDWLLREGEPLVLSAFVVNRLKCLLRAA